ncbi:MAG: response regulator transcription factor [bacterium]|nr:response regulator transcription factor [bacterium]
MKKIKILIVDDEQPARRKIRSYLKEESGIDSVVEAGNGVEAVRLIGEEKPGLVFLDIQMPGMTGFEVIEAVGIDEMPAVIFVTAYDQYAIRAFEVQAVDYLLKPFDQERFRKSYHRALEQLEQRSGEGEAAVVVRRLLEEINREKGYLQRVMVKKGPRFFFVKTGEVMYISAEEKYIKLHTREETYLIRETMSRMEERLDPAVFVRIHRSFIVNIDFIKEIQSWSHGDYIVILKNGTKLNLSRRFSERLLAVF